MKSNQIFLSSTSVSIELDGNNPYYSGFEYDVYLNGQKVLSNVNTNVFSIYDLKPNTKYDLSFKSNVEIEGLSFKTLKISTYANVKDFGAVGDGIHDDTLAIQTAIFAVGKNGLVIVPKGTYLIKSLYMKDDTEVYLKEGAMLKASTNRLDFPILPKTLEYNGKEEVLGNWEGNPSDIFTSPVMFLNVKNVKLYGLGSVNGGGADGDWWINVREKKIAYRPRGVFIAKSKNIGLQGITVENTASWTVHPWFSDDLKLIDLMIKNPADSPNTDGCNPESCQNVDMIGLKFSVGDDCISLKSGKIYMAKNHYKPSRYINIRNCFMNRGHGALVIGSEMASGVMDVNVEKCLFFGTDRGLRIKTRRGRGEKAVIDNISFNNIKMDEVLNPFVINMYYFCDPDGKSEYVYSKKPYPVDERTPHLGKFKFTNCDCTKTMCSAGYFYGLPEAPIDEIVLENINIDFVENDMMYRPAMMSNVDEVNMLGLYFNYVNKVELINVNVTGNKGDKVITENVKELKE